MKIGVRKPSLKKAIKASTTGKAKNPKRAVKNAVYKKTTVGVKDLLK